MLSARIFSRHWRFELDEVGVGRYVQRARACDGHGKVGNDSSGARAHALGLLCAMQISFWYRMRYVPIPFRHPNMILNHAFLFLGRLGFIFGSALFSVVGFRHLSELDRGTDILAARRGIILVGCLFALFSLNPLPPSIELRPPEMP
jgi:hypothetical protein